ncbi:MAG: hypothetical protein A2V88_17305 [Elusimicrobia bacterium RBG_16_66_12]|nr:MAG: hypothetical protein A2V88_17305 [Elusimicrobia bacterium RBG_16_66_12]
MMTARRFLWTLLLAPAAPAPAAAAKVELVPVETARSAPAARPALQPTLGAPLIAPLAAPLAVPAPVPAAIPAAPAAQQTVIPSAPADPGAPIFDGDFGDKTSLAEAVAAPDIIPEWPGRTGDVARIAGRTYVLGERLGAVVQANGHGDYEGTNPVYRVKDQPLVVKLIHPGFKEIGLFGGERDALVEMARLPIAHSGLVASSADGLVLVKELVSGVSLRRVTEAGPLSPEQRAALLEMAALYVSLGRTADLSLTNLVWQEKERRLVLIDSGGFDFAQPWAPLGQILSRRNLFGIDGAGFLSALRKRLGPDSPAWRAVETSARSPAYQALLADLHDRGRR